MCDGCGKARASHEVKKDGKMLKYCGVCYLICGEDVDKDIPVAHLDRASVS
jgi:hypothetical protein